MVKLDLQFFGGRGSTSSSGGGAGSGNRKTQKEHMTWSEPPSKAQQLAQQNGIDLYDAGKQVSSVEAYCGISYDSIRDAQYNGRTGTSDYNKAQQIEQFIAQSPVWAGGDLYRGIKLPKESVSQLMVGAKIDMRGMSSWSSKESVAESFAETYGGSKKSVIFRTKGTKKGTSVTHLSGYGKSESEVLISGKATWTIKKISQSNGIIYVDVKENK